MGISLTSEALSAKWAGVPYSARIVLARMCMTAKDADHPNAVYWGGWQELALTMRGKDDATARRQVTTALAELERAGAVRRLSDGKPGQRARFLLFPTCGESGDAANNGG